MNWNHSSDVEDSIHTKIDFFFAVFGIGDLVRRNISWMIAFHDIKYKPNVEIPLKLNHLPAIEIGKRLTKPFYCVVVSISWTSFWFCFIHIYSFWWLNILYIDCPVSSGTVSVDGFICCFFHFSVAFLSLFCEINIGHNLFIDSIYMLVVGSNTILLYYWML